MNSVASRPALSFPSPDTAGFCAALTMLAAAALVVLAKPLALLFRLVPRSYNEGWNAFWADAVMHKSALYVSADSLIANNYPPVSFYLVGLVGRATGDNVIAGRLVSLVSFVVLVLVVYLFLRAVGAARLTALAGAALLLITFAAYGAPYIAMNDPQMLAHAFMLSALAVLWRSDFARVAVVAGALLMLLGGFTKHLLIPLPVAVSVWIALYRRDRLGLWLGCFAIGVPLGLWLTSNSYPSFLDDLLSARVYSFHRTVSSALHTILRFLPLLLLGAIPLVKGMRVRGRAELSPVLVLTLLYLVASLIIGAVAAGGDGVTRNAFFDLLIASALFATLGLDALWKHSRSSGPLGFSAAPAVMMFFGVGMALYAIALVPRTLEDMREVDALERDTRTTVAMIDRLGQGHAACETLALCYWAGGPFTVDFFTYGQKMRTGALSADTCRAALERGDYPVLQLEPARRSSPPGERLGPCTPAIDEYYTEAFRSRVATLMVPKRTPARS